MRNLIKRVDGYVVVGPWSHLLDELKISAPRITISSGVADKLYERLLKVNKKDFDHTIIFIGNVNQSRIFYKGLDIILNALKIVREKYPDTIIKITGRSRLDTYYAGVEYTGFIKDIVPIISSSSLAINMGRGDTFPVGTIESMLAGIPTIVSTDTGTKEIVAKVDKSFIVKPDATKLAFKIIKYFEMDYIEKLKLSKKFKRAAIPYKTSYVVLDFKQKWSRLLQEVESKS